VNKIINNEQPSNAHDQCLALEEPELCHQFINGHNEAICIYEDMYWTMMNKYHTFTVLQHCNIEHYLGEMTFTRAALERYDPKKMEEKKREDKITNADKYDQVYVATIKMHQYMLMMSGREDFNVPKMLI
jgi:hypothetical protein